MTVPERERQHRHAGDRRLPGPGSRACGASVGLEVPSKARHAGVEDVAERSPAAARGSRARPYSGSGRRCFTEKMRRSSMPLMWSACSWVYSTASTCDRRGSDQLQAQFRRGVDEERDTVDVHQRAGAGAAVARIGRAADGAVAPDLRYPERGARAEKGQPHARYTASTLRRLVVPGVSNGTPAVTTMRSPSDASPARQQLLARDRRAARRTTESAAPAPGPRPTPAKAGGRSRPRASRRGSAPTGR